MRVPALYGSILPGGSMREGMSKPGERRLTQTDAPIIARDDVVGINLERTGEHQRLDILQQQFVLKNTTRQNYGIRPMDRTKRRQRMAKALSNAAVKGARNFCGIAPAQPVVGRAFQ